MAVRNVILNQIGDSTQVQFSVPPETMYFSSGADVVMETHDKIHIRICRANLYYKVKSQIPLIKISTGGDSVLIKNPDKKFFIIE